MCLMGYMDTLIVLKWTTDYTHKEYEAPSIISTMISALLNGGKIEGRSFIGTHAQNALVSNVLVSKYFLNSRHLCNLRSMDAICQAVLLE